MVQRKPIIWFLVISFAISWTLFLAPLAFKSNPAAYRQAALLFWALAMWGPGIAAIVATVWVAKEPFSALRLNKLGKARYYVIAWLLPPLMCFLAVGLTVLIGTGKLDLSFSTLKAMLEQTPSTRAIPIGLVVALQLLQGLLLGPIINIFATMGEELGWRGFLLPRLLPLGQWRAILLSGVIWGIWHAPAILQGYNYPQHPAWGVLLMTVSTVMLGTIFSWLYLATRSPWVAALAHGSLNAWAGLPLLFLAAGFDMAYGGTIISMTGWIVMGVVIGILVLTKQLPVKLPEEPLAAATAVME